MEFSRNSHCLFNKAFNSVVKGRWGFGYTNKITAVARILCLLEGALSAPNQPP